MFHSELKVRQALSSVRDDEQDRRLEVGEARVIGIFRFNPVNHAVPLSLLLRSRPPYPQVPDLHNFLTNAN